MDDAAVSRRRARIQEIFYIAFYPSLLLHCRAALVLLAVGYNVLNRVTAREARPARARSR